MAKKFENNEVNGASDKIRKLANTVVLIGKLAELEVKQGVSDKKIPWISFKGVVQCGENKSETCRFEAMSMQFKVDKDSGEKTEKKKYKTMLAFANKYKAQTLAGGIAFEDAPTVKLLGSYVNGDYVNAQDELKETVRIDVSGFMNAEAIDELGATATVEGYIKKIAPETDKETESETGRLRMEIATADFFSNLVPLNFFVVEADNADDVSDSYEMGQTAKFYITYKLSETKAPMSKGGFGEKRAENRSRYETVITGAEAPYDEDDKLSIDKSALKIAINERKIRLEELKEKGYQGGKSASTPKVATATFATATAKKFNATPSEDMDEDEVVF